MNKYKVLLTVDDNEDALSMVEVWANNEESAGHVAAMMLLSESEAKSAKVMDVKKVGEDD